MITLTTVPTDTLVTLDELKDHLVIEHDNDDDRLTMLLDTTRDLIESDTDLAITSQVWKQTDCRFYNQHHLQKHPISSVSVSYYNTSNVLTALAADQYYLAASDYFAYMQPVDSWPDTYDRPDAVQITLTCGLDSVPDRIKQACLLLCGAWNELREAELVGSSKPIDLGYERLIKSMRRGWAC